MRCPGCGRESIEGGVFCAYCGRSLSPMSVSPATHPAENLKRADKRLLFMVIVVFSITMFGTVILSPLLLASESEEKVIVIDPNSYYAVRLEYYGIGFLEYSDRQVAGPPILLLELTQGNYDKFVAGEDYDYIGLGMIASGGEGHSTQMGTIWVRYLVFLNDNPSAASIEFGYTATPFASLLVAGPLFGASLLIILFAVVVSKRRSSMH